MDFKTYLKNYPDENGRFGPYGGAYLTEELIPAFIEIADAYQTICHSSQFINELRRIRKEFQGRPTPVYHCERLSRQISNCQIYLKREDLNHTGAHKLNHCMGEGLLAKFMGKKRLIAETGAGQHGVALATAAAFFGLECEIHMGEVDIAKQASNVTKMKILGAKVVPVTRGLKTLKEAVDSAFESYAKNYKDSIYCIGSVVGPHPFPLMVRDFQSVVGYEAKDQFVEMTGLLPDAICACVGGGSNSSGMFIPFLDEPVEIYGVEPLGRGSKMGDHAASMTYGTIGTSDPKETVIVLSDDVITVDGKEISTDVKAAVFASNDIIYYEDKDSYESGNPYGEGTAADKHSKEEADLHTVVNITKPGTYRISGRLSHGQISIDLGEDAKRDPSAVVTLVLDGVEITNTVAPAVIFYNVYECNTAWVAYDEDETEDYTAAKDVDTSDAGANVIIADGSVNQINGSYVARIYKDNGNKKKKHKYDGAFYSKMSMNVNGEKENTGVLNIVAENEGLDTEMHLTINGGKINIFSQDDGINTNEDGVSVTTINGGSLHIVAGLGAEGDGVDSNGYLVINGGVVIATAKPQSDSGLDADLGSFINGGYVVATGSTMDWAESDSDQVTMNLQFASMQDNTEAIIITDTEGNVVFAYDPDKDETTGTNNRGYRGAVVSSPDFAVGSTYYVYIGGEVDGEDVDGLYDISTVKGFTGGIRQIYTGTDVRGFRGMGMRPGMQPGGFDPFGGRNFNQGVSTQIDSEMANIIFNLIKERIADEEITLDEIMACTTVQEFIELMGIDVHGALIPDGQRPDMPEGEIPEFPEGGMFTPEGNSNNIQTAGDANFEFYMNDKVNAFSGVADEV